MYLDWVHSARISQSLQVTGSLILQIILCCLIVVYVCLSFKGKQTCCDRSLPGSLRRPVHFEGSIRCTVTVYIASGVIASGGLGVAGPKLTGLGQLSQ